jgi:hypothetical protein
MHQVAEFHAAKWVVTEILNNGSAIRVTVCLLELVFRQRRKSHKQKRAHLVGPDKIHDLFVSEHRVCD